MPEISSAALLALAALAALDEAVCDFAFVESGVCAMARVLSNKVNERSVLKREWMVLNMDLSDVNADIILLLAQKYKPHAVGFQTRIGKALSIR